MRRGQPQYRVDLILVLEGAQHARPYVPGSANNDHPHGALFTHRPRGVTPRVAAKARLLTEWRLTCTLGNSSRPLQE